MTDPERDARVSERYRALGREQPPRALDEAILAAARRRRRRWAVPVSIAAVIVLAVGVTLRVQLEQPQQPEEVALAPKVMEAPPIAARKLEAPAGATADRAEPTGRVGAGVAVGKISAPPETPETPEQWLERIGKLRDAGKAREADESLAEFRKRYPDYRMSAAMRARVAPR